MAATFRLQSSLVVCHRLGDAAGLPGFMPLQHGNRALVSLLLLLVHRLQLVYVMKVVCPLRLQPAKGSVLSVYCSKLHRGAVCTQTVPSAWISQAPKQRIKDQQRLVPSGGARNRKINRRYRVGVLQVPPQVSSPVPRWYRALRLRWLHFGWRCRGEGGMLAMSR